MQKFYTYSFASFVPRPKVSLEVEWSTALGK